MSATPQRRSLLPVRSVPREPLAEETVAQVAALNGFQTVETPDTAAPEAPPSKGTPAKATPLKATQSGPTHETASAVASGMRRKRQPTGRDHQFNTRLRRDTLDYIYAEANERNIPIAQVIEEGMEALKGSRSQRAKP
jgi:hypothetical protein